MRPIEADFGAGEFTSLPVRAGDAVMYQGVTHCHGGLEPNPNRWSAHLFNFEKAMAKE